MSDCLTCERRDAGRESALCSKCRRNDTYGDHYREHPAVVAYKEMLTHDERDKAILNQRRSQLQNLSLRDFRVRFQDEELAEKNLQGE